METFVWNHETGSSVSLPSYDVDNLVNIGEFIIPKHGLTRLENRRYILKELKEWLCGLRLQTQVQELLRKDVTIESIREDVNTGKFPAGRMYTIVKILDPSSTGIWGTREVAQLCYSMCSANLESRTHTINEDIHDLVIGFVDVDKLSDGCVIRSLWDKTPFDPLRMASPLSETESETELPDTVPSIDAKIDLALENYYSFILTPVTISTNIGGISVFFGLLAIYVWIVLMGKGL